MYAMQVSVLSYGCALKVSYGNRDKVYMLIALWITICFDKTTYIYICLVVNPSNWAEKPTKK